MKLLAFTIGGQKIGVDIKSWNTDTLSGNTAFQAIADTGSTPTNYTNISSFDNWGNLGGGTTLTPDQIKAEMLKLIPSVPTTAQYLTLESYATAGLNSVSKVGSSIVFGGVQSSTTSLTGTTSNAITGATNLGSGNAIFTSVSSSKLQLKSISGGTGISISNTGNLINICGCVFNWAGTTANGVGTYVSSTCACSNPNMTFDGSSLSVTGNVKASTYVCAPTITGSTKVCSPIVIGTTCACAGILCATTVVTAACSIGTTCVCSPVVLASTSSCSPIHCGACGYFATIVCSPTITGSTKVCSPIVCGTSCITSPIACGSTCAISPITIGSTCVCGPVGLFSTSSCSPIHCGACGYFSTAVCSPVITGSTKVCTPIMIATSCVCIVATPPVGNVQQPTVFWDSTGKILDAKQLTGGTDQYIYKECTTLCCTTSTTCVKYLGYSGTTLAGRYHVDFNSLFGNVTGGACTCVAYKIDNTIQGAIILTRDTEAGWSHSEPLSRDVTLTAATHCFDVWYWNAAGIACINYASVRASRIC